MSYFCYNTVYACLKKKKKKGYLNFQPTAQVRCHWTRGPVWVIDYWKAGQQDNRKIAFWLTVYCRLFQLEHINSLPYDSQTVQINLLWLTVIYSYLYISERYVWPTSLDTFIYSDLVAYICVFDMRNRLMGYIIYR